MQLMDELFHLGTPEISDALDACGIEGALLGISPLLSKMKLVGPVFTVKYLAYAERPDEFSGAGNYIDEVPPNAVIVIDNQGRNDCTTWGDILTQVAIIKNIAGTVVHGAVRDVEFIKKVKYPLFSKSIYMRTGKNRVYKAWHQQQLNINNVTVNPGDILIGDDNGVVIIPKNLLEEIIVKAKNIKANEQKIIESVSKGLSLEEARTKYHYNKPWIERRDEHP